MLTRNEALKLIKDRIKNGNLIKHSLAVESIMKKMAAYFNQDENTWSLAGLLHDIDYEQTKNSPFEHSRLGSQILKELVLPESITQAVLVHNEIHNLPRKSLLDKCLYAVDPVTGLITAAALVLPSKKLNDLSVESISKRFKEKRFAAGANRRAITSIEELDLPLSKFFEISLKAMQEISIELDL